MTDNSFGQIIQETDKLSKVGGAFNGGDNDDSNSIFDQRNGRDNMNDSAIEKALHNLLTETNDHFAIAESLNTHANQQSKSQDNSIVDNTNTDRATMEIDKVTNKKNVSTDLDNIIENVIISMNANQALISDKRNLNSPFTNNIHINEENPFILGNILNDQDNPTISFDLDNLDFTNTFFHEFSNNNVISNSNITSTGIATITDDKNNNHKDNDLKRKLDNTDIDFQEFGKRGKSSKTDTDNSKEPPLLSPASLSPMSFLSTDNNELKTNELDNDNSRNITNKDSDNTTNLHDNTHNNTNDNKIHEMPNDLLKNNRNTQSTSKNNHNGKNRYPLNSITNSAYSPQPFTHEKLTNEYTIHQISEMKKRIINTHKLLLNFNFLKDSYAKTCIELKKSLNALRDSELHRAHLLLENETLKAKLLELKSCRNDQS